MYCGVLKVFEMPLIKIKKKNHAVLQVLTDPITRRDISEHFSFMVNNAQFIKSVKEGRWNGKINLFEPGTGELPIGLSEELINWADENNHEVETETDPFYGSVFEDNDESVDMTFLNRWVLTGKKGETIEPYDHQYESIRDFLENGRRLLVSPTNSGKTFNIYSIVRRVREIEIAEGNQNKTLIVVPSQNLVNQTRKDFETYSQKDDGFDAEEEIHMIYQGHEKKKDKNIIISTWQSLQDMSDDFFEDFTMVVVDEVHRATAKKLTGIVNACTEARYRFGCTGTLKGCQMSEMQLNGMFGATKEVTNNKEMIDRGQSSDVQIDVLLLNHPPNVRSKSGKNFQKEVKFLTMMESRNVFIAKLAKGFEGNKVIFYDRREHGEALERILKEMVDDESKIFLVHGGIKTKNRMEFHQKMEEETDCVLIASLGTTSTGIDISNIQVCLFTHPVKSIITLKQSIGRLLRLNKGTKQKRFVDLVDDFSRGDYVNYTLKHGRERMKIYKKEGFKTKLMKIKMPSPDDNQKRLF